MNAQYFIPPPSVPDFLYKWSLEAWHDLLAWSWNEYRARLKQNARRGHYKELAVQASEFSPERVLAELKGFRRMCALLAQNENLWNQLTRAQRRYIVNCYNLRDLLLRE